MSDTLAGKVVLITGASSGIGRASALKFAEQGASLVLASRNAEALENLERELYSPGTPTLSVPTDVTNKATVVNMVEAAMQTFGRIDILVNAAGVGVIRPSLELSEADFDRMMAVNAKGTFLVSQEAGARMAEARKGHIINLPGILGKAAMMNASGYCASKWAVTGMTKAMALDFKRFGVKFTLLHFGGVDSPFWDKIDGMRVQRDKMLTVNDAANAVLFAATQPDMGVLGEIVLQPESHQL
ncbi:MAG TPA: SDR family oxidoreductase [Chloroflexia bacterium]|nr:SDR family oxidoreductase [Chloroflexia bacterium]